MLKVTLKVRKPWKTGWYCDKFVVKLTNYSLC